MWLPFGTVARPGLAEASVEFVEIVRHVRLRSFQSSRARCAARSPVVSSSNASLDLVERQPMRDQPVERQPAAPVRSRITSEVALGARRAVEAPEDAPLHARDRERGQLRRPRPRAGCRSAPPRRACASRGTRPASPRAAGRLDRVVDAAARGLAHRLGGRLGAEPAQSTASVAPSARAPPRACRCATSTATIGAAPAATAPMKRREADAAAADHRDALAGPHRRAAPDGADAGRDRAADEPGDSNGTSSGSGRSERSGTTACSANVERNE